MSSNSLKKNKIELAHKQLLEPLLRSCNVMLSEYSFANIYLFRNVHNYELVYGQDLYIQGKTYDGNTFLMPTSVQSFQTLITDDEALDGIDFCFPIPEEWLLTTDLKWSVHYNEADSDYIFDTLHLSRYDGRGLSKKRNLVKQFMEHYQATAKPLVADDALQVLSRIAHKEDEEACIDAINNFSELGLEGTIYYVDSQPVGFIIGEKLTADTFCMHFAKADISYKGVYQYINQEFAKSLADRYQFINMEQDLGSPELRQSKHSYEPIRYCKKLRVKQKK